ncbi:hypothetical protein BGZ54_006729 [Gamsiella multidivaricata]|nr:hypothetical protein BGZ54_006729 [Gamsiella multidivaricata]
MSAQTFPQGRPLPTAHIIGAGLGGLMLGTLLERINVLYHINERATKVHPLESATSLGAGTLSVFDQLGLLEEIESFAAGYPTVACHELQHCHSCDWQVIGRLLAPVPSGPQIGTVLGVNLHI